MVLPRLETCLALREFLPSLLAQYGASAQWADPVTTIEKTGDRLRLLDIIHKIVVA